jgi:hypothetical protein
LTPPEQLRMRLFVSYHTPDAVAARRVAEMLQTARVDLTVFFAPRRSR